MTAQDIELDEVVDVPLDFGEMTVPATPGGVAAKREKFRIAILGDFSGRANRGIAEFGEKLGGRKPMKLDVDTIDDVIARFRTQLTLPIGPGGAAVSVELGSIDDLHPDELYENVDMFSELQNLRRLVMSGKSEKALADLRAWGDEYGAFKSLARRRPRGSAVPADKRLSEFAELIGAGAEAMPQPTPTEQLIQRVVAPYVMKAPDPDQGAMVEAIDQALSGAMRALLHNPDFQAVESAWRSLDVLARRIETGGGLELVLYDVSAEEFAIDLASAEDLAESGMFQMLAEKPGLDIAQGGLSAIVALYQFEETPPHAELLGRIAKIAAYADAPFTAAMSPKYLETKTDDLHPMVAKAFTELKALPEAAYLGLASPRFMLRQPYGSRTDPIDPFEFEEFTRAEGLKGMLWANPAVLVAVLLGASWVQGGGKVSLGSVMTLGDIPFFYVTDEYGDQVALPCTERLMTERTASEAARRGYMPVLSLQGRTEVRLGSFRSITGDELAGPWAENDVGGHAGALKRLTAAEAAVTPGAAGGEGDGATAAAPAEEPLLPGDEGDDLDALLAALEETTEAEPEPAAAEEEEEDATTDLDALLAALDEPDPAEAEAGDDDLDALLAGLDDDAGADGAEDPAAEADETDGGEAEEDDLDALLASFGDDDLAEPAGDDDVDDELDALLKDL